MKKKAVTINSAQRVQLTLWVHKRDGSELTPYDFLSSQASKDLGFEITRDAMRRMWAAVHGARIVCACSSPETKLMELELRIKKIEDILLP